MNTFKTITLALMLIIFSVTGLRAEEISLEQFAKEFVTVIQAKDVDKIKQLLRDNPNTAEQFQQMLARAGKDELAGLVGKFRQILSAGDSNPTLDRLQEEGKKAYYAADYPTALKKWKQGLNLSRQAENKQDISVFLGNIGVVYDNLGSYPKALEYYQQALAIHQEIGDKRGIGNNLTNLGVVYQNLGSYPKALEYFQQALAIHQEIGDKRGEGINLGNIGVVYKNLGSYPKALEYYQQALAIHQEIGDKRGEGADLSNIGVLYKNLGKYQQAKKAFQDSLAIKIAIGSGETWQAQRGLASTEVKLNQPEPAIQHYEQALDNIERLRAGLEKEHKISFMRGRLYVYDELIALLQSLHPNHPKKGYDRKAIETFERKQGRVLLEEMGQSGARRFSGLSK